MVPIFAGPVIAVYRLGNHRSPPIGGPERRWQLNSYLGAHAIGDPEK